MRFVWSGSRGEDTTSTESSMDVWSECEVGGSVGGGRRKRENEERGLKMLGEGGADDGRPTAFAFHHSELEHWENSPSVLLWPSNTPIILRVWWQYSAHHIPYIYNVLLDSSSVYSFSVTRHNSVLGHYSTLTLFIYFLLWGLIGKRHLRLVHQVVFTIDPSGFNITVHKWFKLPITKYNK